MTSADMISFLTILFIFFFFFFFFFFFISLAAAAQSDTISNHQTLSGNQTIVSSQGNFELGFFTPGNSSKYYIGIWFKKVSHQNVVWIANREAPILDTSHAQLKIQHGNLVLLNESQHVVWSTDSTRSETVIAVLLDNGNLVLQGLGSSGGDETLWESFEHPSHVFIPGVKFGYNKRTGRKTVFTSWKNSEDPAPGLFSHEPVLNTKEFVLKWNGSQQYWSSGEWNGHIFSGVPEMRFNVMFNFSYVDNSNESYYVYSQNDPSLISKYIMDVSGQLKNFMWTNNSGWMLYWAMPKQQCDVYAYCGAFGVCSMSLSQPCSCLPGFKHRSDKDWGLQDYSGGCVRETNLQCVDDNGVDSEETKD